MLRQSRNRPDNWAGNLYTKYYGGKKARREFFDALAAWHHPERVLYPGSFIHVTASFVFPSVVYVDINRNARRFFSETDAVAALIEKNKIFPQKPALVFHGTNYEAAIDEAERSFDLLISFYAGFVSEHCRRYLKIGGILAANNSHGDAGLAFINSGYEFIGVLQRRGEQLRVSEDNLDAYFESKKEVNEEALRKLKRGIGYTKSAPAYLFRRVS